LGTASDAFEPNVTVPPTLATGAAALEPAPPAAPPAALDMAELAPAELDPAEGLAAAGLDVEVAELAPPDDVPVQADSRGTAAALAMPAPITRSIARRFMPALRSSPPKSESVTVDLRFHGGRPSTTESEQNFPPTGGEVNTSGLRNHNGS
jgi:hypothetical protein